ncbi:MAG TPA: DinB family protein [Bryobacteraceae bacterium]|nr:DinB family protein [Bryobacteraceae bacterium]
MQNIYGARQLAASFRTVRQNTIQIAEDIPEEKYTFTPAEGSRSVEQALAHIAVSTRMWQEAHSLGTTNMQEYDWATAFLDLDTEEKKKRSKKELVDLLKDEEERFAGFLDQLSDEKLAEQISEDPSQPPKSRLEALMSAKEHEMHCRGQLMLIERMLGIVPHLTRRYAEMEREMREAAAKKRG